MEESMQYVENTEYAEDNTQYGISTQEYLQMDGQIPLTDPFWQTKSVRNLNSNSSTGRSSFALSRYEA